MARPKTIIWTKSELESLGSVPDIFIANKKKVSTATVSQKRRDLGIPAFQVHAPKHNFTPEEIQILKTNTAENAARLIGVSEKVIHYTRMRHGIRVTFDSAIDYPPWADIAEIPQSDFYKEISAYYKSQTGRTLTYPLLSEYCFWSVSRLQKWFTCGTAQEPLTKAVRHHIWLAVIFSINRVKTK